MCLQRPPAISYPIKILAKISRRQADWFPQLKTVESMTDRSCTSLPESICVVNNPQRWSFNGTETLKCGLRDGHNEYHCWESFFPVGEKPYCCPPLTFFFSSLCSIHWLPLKCFFLAGLLWGAPRMHIFLQVTGPRKKHQSVRAQ